ncbi:YnfA family protein [Cellvibrio sp. QJXJ]|uniref:YnfA family protein n=1 Tax=Cellvibrio sp. QJXJ TaxID=2964606 RepID=UPI0039659651
MVVAANDSPFGRRAPSAMPWLCAWVSLALFAWLLTLHPTAAGRTYAAYAGIYLGVALLWLRIVDGVALTRWDIAGALVALVGVTIIVIQPTAD